MFRKYRKGTASKKKAEESDNTTPSKKKQQEEAFFQRGNKKIVKAVSEKRPIEAARSAGLRILEAACASMQESYSEASDSTQGKGLELAQQMISDGIQDISIITEALEKIKASLRSLAFKLDAEVSQPLPGSNTLGQGFLNKSSEDRVWHVIEMAISQSHMPTKEGAPVGRYDFQSHPELWSAYIAELLAGLPEEPKIITGTPIHHTFPSKVENAESRNVPQAIANREDLDSKTESDKAETRKGHFLRRLFKSKKGKNRKNRKN